MKVFSIAVLFISTLSISAYGSNAYDSGSGVLSISHQGETRGTLTTATGNQIQGYFTGLEDNSRYRLLQFRAEGEDDFTVYSADRIREAETETGAHFFSFSSELSRETLPTLIGERIYETDQDLYKTLDNEGNGHFFLINRNGQPLYLPEYRYRAALRSVFGDCGEVVTDYRDMEAFYGKDYLMLLFLNMTDVWDMKWMLKQEPAERIPGARNSTEPV